MKGLRMGGVLSKGWVLLALILAAFIACENPTGPSTGGGASGNPGGGAGGGSGDVPPSPITITFVLDVNGGSSGPQLTTNFTAPAPLQATAGVPVRLTQGIGFEATANPGAQEPITLHASGWSTKSFAAQTADWPTPTGEGYYLPTYEAAFNSDTTLYVRWIPDSFAVRLEYQNPDNSSQTVLGPILSVGDSVVLETWAQFQDRLSPSWGIQANREIFKWGKPGPTPNWDPGISKTMADFGWQQQAQPGIPVLPVQYQTRTYHMVTFDYNGATGSIGTQTRRVFTHSENGTFVNVFGQPGWGENDFILPTRDNVSFGGWFTSLNGGDPWSTAPSGQMPWQWNNSTVATADITLYARWFANVTFHPNGGAFGENTTQAVQVNAGGTSTIAPSNPTPAYAHDVFLGWYRDSGFSTPPSNFAITGHTTFYAGYGPQYSVGQQGPGGGTIFSVKDGPGPRATSAQTWRFLEAAASDLTTTYQWGFDSTTQPDSLNPDSVWRPYGGANEYNANNVLGGGKNFTDQILARLAVSGVPAYSSVAARAAREYRGGDKDDWYLPTGPELQEMNNHRNILNLNTSTKYWSSVSRWDADGTINRPFNRAFAVQFNPAGFNPSVSVDEMGRGIAYRVRPVRRF